MLATQEPFSKLLLFTKIYGLSDGGAKTKVWMKIVQVAMFLIFFLICFILFVIQIISIQEFKAFVKALTVLSSLIIVMVKIVNFYFKSTSIMVLLNSFTETNDPEAKEQMGKYLRHSNIYFRVTVVITTLIMSVTILSPLVTGIFSIPFYFPKFIIDSKFYFTINFVLSSGLAVYSTVAIFLLDAFTLCVLIVIQGYTKRMRIEFREMKLNPENIKRCVETHRSLIRYIKKTLKENEPLSNIKI